MEYLVELLKLILPAGAVLYGMYLVVMSFLSKEREKMLVELKSQHTQTILPLRLQAAERICLLLERITPNNLVRRSSPSEFSAAELHSRLVSEVREEFNHNLSQQVYFTDEAWETVRKAVEDTVTIINMSRQHLGAEASGMELAKAIFSQSLEQKNDSISQALKQIKSEVQHYF